MEEDFYSRLNNKAASARGAGAGSIVLTALVAFLLGGAMVGLAAWNYGYNPFGAKETAQTPARVPLASPAPGAGANAEGSNDAAAAVQAVEMVASQQGGIEARVVAMEQRLTALDLQAQAAYGNASRAEALLIAFAARRTIERGQPLGYLEQQIKVRFEDGFPNAVAAVLAAAERPTTLEGLREGLEELTPRLLADPEHESAWDWFTRELGELFVIRRLSTPSPAPGRRLDRAKMFLETGQVENAIAQVRQLPGAGRAASWIADAERYAAALAALDRLESSAIVGPEGARDVRDASIGRASASRAQ